MCHRAGPALNTETTPRDWVVAKGYAMRAQVPRRNSPLSAELFGASNLTTSSWTACHTNCSRTAGCAAYKWIPNTGACQHYVNEPNATNLLTPCNGTTEADCMFGYRIPGSCGSSASRGIRCAGCDARALAAPLIVTVQQV